MPLTAYQLDWIEKVSKKPLNDEALQKASKVQQQREEFLQKDVVEVLNKKRKQIDDAQKVVLKNRVDTKGIEKLWRKALGKDPKKTKEMPWRAKDEDLGSGWQTRMDLEVDTKEDVGEDTLAIPEDQLRALNDALATVLEMQNQMLLQYDDEGNRLFSDDDIRRELWTPLVRSGLIPENMVPDKFSEEANAFKGATEIYGDRIKDYSKKSTGKEKLLKGLNIAKEVVTLTGTIVTSSIMMDVSTQMAANSEAIRTGVDANGNTVNIGDLKQKNVELQNQIDLATMASTIATGGLDLTIAGVTATTKKTDEGRWAGLVDKVFQVLGSCISAAVAPLNVAINPDVAKGNDQGKQETYQASMLSSILQAEMTGGRVLCQLIQIGVEKDEGKQKALISGVVSTIADAFNTGMTAYITYVNKTDTNAGAALTQINAGVTEGIRAIGQAPLILKALKEENYKQAGMLLGGFAVQAAFSGPSEELYNSVRPQVSTDQSKQDSFAKSQFEQTSITDSSTDQGSAKVMSALDKLFSSYDKSIVANLANAKLPELDGTTAAKLKKQIAQEVEDKQKADAEKQLKEHFTPEVIEQMFKEVDTKMIGYEEMYANANPKQDLDGQPPTDVEKALDAIDRAIANTAELRARAEIINAVTATTVGVVASFVPGAGAAVAAQKMAMDIYALVKAVEIHNKWCDSMEVAFRANSAYGAGIERTMLGARITLSRTSVKLVLDSLQLGAQIGRIFDPTGGATIASTALTLTQALVEFGYKMATEAEIARAWEAYKDAKANPGNRKRARKALRLNSTLAKCAIAYGACMADDPVAKEAIRISGLSPELLANDKDVCKRLVSYLENELNQDPIVLEVEKSPRPWHPADRPLLTAESWFQYKAAAMKAATPRLAPVSGSTPAIDKTLSDLAAGDCWAGKQSYAEARVAAVKDDDPDAKVQALAEKSFALLKQLQVAFKGYRPLAAGPNGTTDQPHKDMADIVKTYLALITLNLISAEKDGKKVEPPS